MNFRFEVKNTIARLSKSDLALKCPFEWNDINCIFLPDFSCCFVDRVSDLGGQLRDWMKQQAVQHGLKTQIYRYFYEWMLPCWFILHVTLFDLSLTSSLFQVRLLRARGSRLSGARGRSSTGLPLISGALLVEITGGIFLKLRLSSKTRSTNWSKTVGHGEGRIEGGKT